MSGSEARPASGTAQPVTISEASLGQPPEAAPPLLIWTWPQAHTVLPAGPTGQQRWGPRGGRRSISQKGVRGREKAPPHMSHRAPTLESVNSHLRMPARCRKMRGGPQPPNRDDPKPHREPWPDQATERAPQGQHRSTSVQKARGLLQVPGTRVM
ncbi:hypothetical protein NDU88_001426 [Pleurodeles waltl]|uniref:Uncharacterized protein n=1 Tax=Pleurodeles waltl TaxID=8319 RepID=A0AAV7R925_PLEWA|nr:hypothetical protein NDU88_001426 [Pleurodeles waltl]